jgi:deazaflavin-dependent oxidoreductase (nitroreductase family)
MVGEEENMTGEKSKEVIELLERCAKEEYCYLTTKGRVSGKPHKIEIWFGILDGTLYLLSGNGEGSDWVKNLVNNPEVTVQIAKHKFSGHAHVLGNEKEDMPIRKLMDAKYQGWQEGRRLSKWARTGLPIAIDFDQAK